MWMFSAWSLSSRAHISFTHLLWQAASCVGVSNLSERRRSPINHVITRFHRFSDENDAMWSIGTPAMLVELALTSKPCHDLIQSRVGNFKKNYNWGAATLNCVHLLPLLDTPRQGWWRLAACLFAVVQQNQWFVNGHAATRKAAGSSWCRRRGTSCHCIQCDYPQPNEHWSHLLHWECATWSAQCRGPGQRSVITRSRSSQPLVSHPHIRRVNDSTAA